MLLTNCNTKKDVVTFNPETHVQLVSSSLAKTIAENFNPVAFFKTENPTNHSPVESKLNGHNIVKSIIIIPDNYNTPAIYVCNFTDNQGFLFVSADFQIAPILAYIEIGEFKKDKVPSALISWVDKTISNIEVVRKGEYDNTKEAKVAWDDYLSQNKITNTQVQSIIQNSVQPFYISVLPGDPVPVPSCVPTYQTVTVGPLLPVTWGQACSYNDLCPIMGCTNTCIGQPNAYTGCVATSTAQVVRYWQAQSNNGYNYVSMPTTFGNTEVQRLMHDIGIIVSMNYGCTASSASATNVVSSLNLNFSIAQPNYGDYQWWVTASNLDNHWPVLLDACTDQTYHDFIIQWWEPSGSCHEWVTDGYQQNIWTTCVTSGPSAGRSEYHYGFLYLHMNWGWHETWVNSNPGATDYNGWFMNQNWNIEGRNLNFQYFVSATTNIHP